nr:Chain C, Caspase-3 [Porites astreoides]
KLFSFGG